MFLQIVDGLSFIHSKGVVHRDIKLENILLDHHGNLKIADFGVSKLVSPEVMYDACGTPAYIAPEMLTGRGYKGVTVDIWSAGIVLYTMLFGNVPFKGQSIEELKP